MKVSLNESSPEFVATWSASPKSQMGQSRPFWRNDSGNSPATARQAGATFPSVAGVEKAAADAARRVAV